MWSTNPAHSTKRRTWNLDEKWTLLNGSTVDMSFANLCLKSGTPTVDLFPSRMSHQVAQYVAWKPLQRSRGRNVNSLDTGSLLRISLILYDPPCTKQNTPRPRTHITLITPCWQTQLWYPHGNANKETNSNTKFSHTFSRSK